MSSEFVKRNAEVQVEKISNGYLLSLSGCNSRDDWVNKKVYLTSIELVTEYMKDYFELPLD